MGAILTHRFRSLVAMQFGQSMFLPQNRSLYFFFGKPINQNLYDEDPNAQHYVMEYYPFDTAAKTTLITDHNYQRVTEVTAVNGFVGTVDPNMSCYGHLYIKSKTGTFPSGANNLTFKYRDTSDNEQTIADLGRVGRVFPITTTDGNANTPADNTYEHLLAHESMIAAKRITTDDIAVAIRRINWIPGKIYYAWSDIAGTKYIRGDQTFTTKIANHPTATSLDEVDYYVLNSDLEVFMCVFGKRTGATVEPKTTNIPTGSTYAQGIFTSSDGYRWKYMCTVLPELRSFLTSSYIPLTLAFNHKLNLIDKRDGSGLGLNTSFSPVTIEGPIQSTLANETASFTSTDMLNADYEANRNVTSTCTMDIVDGIVQTDAISNSISPTLGVANNRTVGSGYVVFTPTEFYTNNTAFSTTEGEGELPAIHVGSYPIDGWNHDILNELFPSTLLFKTDLGNNENDIPLMNFTQVGIMHGIVSFDDNGSTRGRDRDTIPTISAFRSVHFATPVIEMLNYNIGLKHTQVNGGTCIGVSSKVDRILRYIQPHRYCVPYNSGDTVHANIVLSGTGTLANISTLGGEMPASSPSDVSYGDSVEGIAFFDGGAYRVSETTFGQGNILYMEERGVVTKKDNKQETIVLAITF